MTEALRALLAVALMARHAVAHGFDVAAIRAAVERSQAPFVTHDSLAFYHKYKDTLMGDHPIPRPHAQPHDNTGGIRVANVTFPTQYSVANAFPDCQAPTTIFDQGKCGGCWALSVAAATSDRFCQAGVDVVLSPQDLLDCVEGRSRGCSGGYTEDGLDYLNDEGVRSNDCVPFTALDGYCGTACVSGASSQDTRRYFTTTFGQYISSEETRIQEELLEHGSISAVFEVFSDFFFYAGGVYRHVSGDYAGLHAVTLTGWGETKDEGKYWIVKNSWGPDFGESAGGSTTSSKRGFFRIARGLKSNGCNFEGALTAAMARV